VHSADVLRVKETCLENRCLSRCRELLLHPVSGSSLETYSTVEREAKKGFIHKHSLDGVEQVGVLARTLRRSMAPRSLHRSRSSPIGWTTQVSGGLVMCLYYLRFVVIIAEVFVVESYAP
jgi:hypothetical protein